MLAHVMLAASGRLARRVVTQRRQTRQQQVHDANLERHLAQEETIVGAQWRDVTKLT